jgi:hypothetical protein
MQSSYVRTVQRPFERIRWNPRKHSTVPLLAAIQPRSQRAKMRWKRFTPALIRWIPPPRVLHPIPTHASTALILRKSRMRRRACTDLCGGRSAMVVPTATVIASSAALVPRNALVSRDLAKVLVGYAEVTRWGNAERRVHLPCCHKNVILIATNGGKMRTKGE